MDAVVLAGGYATRLWPITRHRAKPLLPVADGCLVDHVLEPLEREDRVENVYVSTNQRFADDFRGYLDDKESSAEVVVEPTTSEDEKLGTVGALAELVDAEGLSDDTLVIAGDNLFSFDVSEFVEFFEDRDAACLAAYDVGSREAAKSYGLVQLDGSRVDGFQEKPDDPESTLVSTACYAFPGDSLDGFAEYLADDNNPDAPGYFLEWLHTREPVHAYIFEGAWFDVGTPEGYLAANAYLLDGEAHVADSASVEGSNLGDDVYVMEDAEVEGSHVRNSILFDGASVESSEVVDSVVGSDAEVEDVDLDGSVVGDFSRIT